MRIRPGTPDDAPDLVASRALIYPYLVRGVESTRRMIAQPPPGERWAGFAAEDDGRLIGWASAHLNIATSEPGFGEISLHVHPRHRDRGTGSKLLAAARQHLRDLGAGRARAWVLPESVEFARRHGFVPSRQMRYSALELRSAPPAPPPPDGVELVALAGLDPAALYAADIAATADEPGDAPYDAVSYDTWRHDVWDNLGLDKVASTAALVDREIVAFSLVLRDGERMWSDMTATRPRYRGRGLARLVKLWSLGRAAERGVTVAYTSNDEANAPMLAVNNRLGYRQVAVQWSCLTTLS